MCVLGPVLSCDCYLLSYKVFVLVFCSTTIVPVDIFSTTLYGVPLYVGQMTLNNCHKILSNFCFSFSSSHSLPECCKWIFITQNKFIVNVHCLPVLYDMTECPAPFLALIRYIPWAFGDVKKPEFFLLSRKRFVVIACSYDAKDEHLILGLQSYDVENETSPSSSACVLNVYLTNPWHFDGIVR